MNYKSICSFFMGFFIIYFISLTVVVDDISAFHDKKNVQFNNEISQIATEVGNYINQTQTMLQSNNVNLSKAVTNLNFAQLRLAELQSWHSNSTIADMMNEMAQESTVFQGTSGSAGGNIGGGSFSTFSPPSASTTSSSPSVSTAAPTTSSSFVPGESIDTASGTATGSFDSSGFGSGTNVAPIEGSIGSGASSSSGTGIGITAGTGGTGTSAGTGGTGTSAGTGGTGTTTPSVGSSSGSFADLSNPGAFSSFQDPIPRQPGQPLHPTLPQTPILPPEPAEPLAPPIPPPPSS